jgi:hypothetical protein
MGPEDAADGTTWLWQMIMADGVVAQIAVRLSRRLTRRGKFAANASFRHTMLRHIRDTAFKIIHYTP